jgi:hypothetical protein
VLEGVDVGGLAVVADGDADVTEGMLRSATAPALPIGMNPHSYMARLRQMPAACSKVTERVRPRIRSGTTRSPPGASWPAQARGSSQAPAVTMIRS